MTSIPSDLVPAGPIPRAALDALLAFVGPVRVLEVTAGPPAAKARCDRAGIAHSTVAAVTREDRATTPADEMPDLVLIVAARARPGSWSPCFDAEYPISRAWLALAPDGVLAVWVPADRPGPPRLLAMVLRALPRWRLHALWNFPERGEPPEDPEDIRPRPPGCACLVMFRAPASPFVEWHA